MRTACRCILSAILILTAGVATGSLVAAHDAHGALLGGPVGSPEAATAARLITGSQDWEHVERVVAYLKARPPRKPLIIMFGTSTVRESTVSDISWERMIRRKAGVVVNAYNLGSTNQTFRQNVRLVEQLPRVPAIVFIGIDVVRFTAAPAGSPVILPAAPVKRPSYAQHRYTSKRILTPARKAALVRDWVRRRYPVFQSNKRANLAELRRLVDACLAKGMHPVLLEAPRNTAAIKNAFDKATTWYRARCRELERRYGGRLDYVDRVRSAKFKNSDFYDIWHAVEPGRAKWQPLLSGLSAQLLKRYGLAPSN